MIPQEIIRKKRDGGVLTEPEIRWFFESYLNGKVTDYQVSAMLMAIFFRGMTLEETGYLTLTARDSGRVFAWPPGNKPVIDKHSTGGVGDKTSIMILPLAILEGLRVPMIAGRGLGHTGGTLDKLESIPGMNVFLSAERAVSQMAALGGFFLGQTEEIAALDRRLYGLRDVTSTIESNPLIVASILSKKLSEGLSGLIMDVKFGAGAFMSSFAAAEALAKDLIAVARSCSLPLRAVLSSMDSPLGRFAGNALEIYECVEIMQGRGDQDLRNLTVELTAQMVDLAYPGRSLTTIRANLNGHLDSGKCYEMFARIIREQGGDLRFLEKEENFFQTKIRKPVYPARDGQMVTSIAVRDLGLAVLSLGGGRKAASDRINPFVGLSGMRAIGEIASAGDPLAVIHGDDESAVAEAETLVRQAYRLGDGACIEPRIKQVLS